MSTLYIDRRAASLSLEGKALVVRFAEERQRPVPIALLERVVLLGTVKLDTRVLLTLAEAGVAVQLGSTRKAARRATLLGAGHKDVRLRQLQYRLSQDEAWRLRFARELVSSKLRAQQGVVQKMLSERPDRRKALYEVQGQLDQVAAQLIQVTKRSSLLGLEGQAARAEFAALAAVLPENLGFTGRRRRPPPDAVNACLSLAYTLLHGRAVQMAHAQGLDPLLGFYHEPAWGRDSLAADLIEPWRPYVNEWVWQLFRKQYLRASCFQYEAGGCFLGKAARPLFFASLEELLRPVNRALRQQVRRLIQSMQTEEEC